MKDLDRFLSLAFAFKKARPWTRLLSVQPFAIRLRDGRIGYVSVQGAFDHEDNGLQLYIGEKGLRTFVQQIENLGPDRFKYLDTIEQTFRITASECLECVLTTKDFLPEAYAKQVTGWAKEHGIHLRGIGAYPLAMRLEAQDAPYWMEEAEDFDDLFEALEASVWMADQLAAKALHLEPYYRLNGKMTLLVRKDDGYRVDEIAVPVSFPMEYPSGDSWDEALMQQVKALHGQKTWSAKLVRPWEVVPMEGNPNRSVFSVLPIIVTDADKDELLESVEPVLNYEQNPGQVLNAIMKGMLKEKQKPQTLIISDDRTQALLAKWCKEAGIALKQTSHCEADYAAVKFLGEIEEDMDEDEDEDGILGLAAAFTEVLEKRPDVLNQITQEWAVQALQDIESNLSDMEPGSKHSDMLLHLRQLLSARASAAGKNKAIAKASGEEDGWHLVTNQSFVISVSYDKGCYRHIRISADATLEDLSAAILFAFDFEDDHGHAFFMNNRIYTHDDPYFCKEIADIGERRTCDYTLFQAIKQDRHAFKYLFDFGEDWVFQCKVLKKLDEPTPDAEIIRSQGDPPIQYPDFDDEDDWDDEDWDGVEWDDDEDDEDGEA